MNYVDFKKEIKKRVADYFPDRYEDIRVEMRETLKGNQFLDSLKIYLDGNNTAPELYVDKFYMDHLRGESITSILTNIACSVLQMRTVDFDLGGINFENAKEHLYCTVVSSQNSKKILDKSPHEKFEDLDLICRWRLTDSNGTAGSFVMTHEMMKSIDLKEEEMFQIAKENTRRFFPPTFDGLGDSCFVLSNKNNYYGATSMIFDDFLEEIGECLEDNYYIIPSSIHEVLVLPASANKWNTLKAMVEDLNEQCVDKKEQLSDSIYYYDVPYKSLKVAGEHTFS